MLKLQYALPSCTQNQEGASEFGSAALICYKVVRPGRLFYFFHGL